MSRPHVPCLLCHPHQANSGQGSIPYSVPSASFVATPQDQPQHHALHLQHIPHMAAMPHVQQHQYIVAPQAPYMSSALQQQQQYYYAPTHYSSFAPAAVPLEAEAVPAPQGAAPRGRRRNAPGAGQRVPQQLWNGRGLAMDAAGGSAGAMMLAAVGGAGAMGMGMDPMHGRLGGYVAMTVEDILAVLQALPRGRSAVQAVGHCLVGLDSRCVLQGMAN